MQVLNADDIAMRLGPKSHFPGTGYTINRKIWILAVPNRE